jgi:PKD repeat protein
MAHTYTPWLIRWYAAMKRGDPDCVLAVGGLDYHSAVTNGYEYIEDIYAAGGGDSFDAVAIHPYGNPLNWQAITDTYNVLVNHGHGHKKLWLNEYGWNTSNETQKAADLTTVLTQLKQPQYEMVFMANHLVLTDLPGTPDNGHDYGLCSRQLSTLTITPRASWHAFKNLDKTFPSSVDFTGTPVSGPLPLLVQFTDTSYYPGASSWSWQFGDGGTSNAQHPSHTYVQDGYYTVQLTVTGPGGPLVRQKSNYISAGAPPPVAGVDNPSFEENGGTLNGWTREIVSGNSYDNPPLSSGSYGLSTSAGTHFGGKITNSLRIDFYFGQVIGTSNWNSLSLDAGWQLSALVNLHARTSVGQPQGVHQVWEIGWNDDGSEPADIMNCDHYQTIAHLTGADTGNDASGFTGLVRSGTLTDVPGLRGVALRVRFYNDAAWWWTFDNIDNVQFTITSVQPPPMPGDRDGDLDVDADDLVQFSACRTGPSTGSVAPGCEWADFDPDNDVDLSDFGVFQRCYTGAGQTGSLVCAD